MQLNRLSQRPLHVQRPASVAIASVHPPCQALPALRLSQCSTRPVRGGLLIALASRSYRSREARQNRAAEQLKQDEEDEEESEESEQVQEQKLQAQLQQQREARERALQQAQQQQQAAPAAAATTSKQQQQTSAPPPPPPPAQAGPSSQGGSEALLSTTAASEATLLLERPQVPLEPEDPLVTEVYTEEEVIHYKPITFQSVAQDTYTWVRETNPGRAVLATAGLALVGTFALACYRYWKKFQAPTNVRKRQLNRNKFLVEELTKTLSKDRSSLNSGVITMIKVRTGYTPVEIFRKYLWYVLRERKFDQAAVDDLVQLKLAAGLTDEQVAEALRERAQRIYDKYGTLMLNTEGMTSQGIQRKAACQALFRKLLYLTEFEPLVRMGSPGATAADLRKIFGATNEDTDRLRIMSLTENDDVDLEAAYKLTISIESMEDDDNTTDEVIRRRSPSPPPPPFGEAAQQAAQQQTPPEQPPQPPPKQA